MMLPILISVSVAPMSYFFCANAPLLVAASTAMAAEKAASIKDLELDGLLPGIRVNTSGTDFAPLSQVQLERFKGGTWELFGEILSGDVGG